MTSAMAMSTTRPRDAVAPNLSDYERACADFDWEAERAQLDGLPSGGLNIAYEAVDRHVLRGRGDRVALRWLGKNGTVRDVSYGELARLTARFARVLERLGLVAGDRLALLCGRSVELYVAALGALRHGVVICPLFSAFGPEPICARLELGGVRALVTSAALYDKKVAPIRHRLPALEHVLVVGEPGRPTPTGTLDLARLMDEADGTHSISATGPETPALLHFTSGTTGKPKGALHVHEAVVMHHYTGRVALDLHDGDIYWCTADPGWVTGTSYGIIAPLTHGITMVVDEAEFDARRWYRILQDQHVTVWYTAPTAIRMLMRVGDELPRAHDLSALRFAASVGEPLNPEAVRWGERVLGRPFRDNWWQTETGGIAIANLAADEVRPGSMGRPLPGIEAAIVRRDGEDVVVLDAPNVEGELALRPGWPSMFRTYLGAPDRYAQCFAGGWYLTGDLARRDADGFYWFVGRADDVIKSAGHLIGPFEVESALMEHPAVAEVGVIGKPDPVAGTIIKAFVALKPGHAPSAALVDELIGFGRRRLGPAAAPREIALTDQLPKTRSGKIMRRLLRARELGLPEGDLSTLERPEGAPGATDD